MAGATSISCNISRNANIDKNPMARFASNEKASVPSGKQNQEHSFPAQNADRTTCGRKSTESRYIILHSIWHFAYSQYGWRHFFFVYL